MKTIGHTNDNNFLVEMTRDEHDALARLAGVSKGWGYVNFGHLDHQAIDQEMSEPVKKVVAYTRAAGAINELYDIVEHMQKMVIEPEGSSAN